MATKNNSMATKNNSMATKNNYGKLFGENGAVFSNDRKYRYSLYRYWDKDLPVVMFIGLNPSTADEMNNDPTIRRVIKFAQKWGYGGVYMMNLFGLVTPYPEELKACADPVGENDMWLDKIRYECDDIIFAWGKFPEATERAKKVMEMFPVAKALVINNDGSPRHPLYVKANTVPVLFKSYNKYYNLKDQI